MKAPAGNCQGELGLRPSHVVAVCKASSPARVAKEMGSRGCFTLHYEASIILWF